jgi:hypothetical protein
VIVFPTNSLPLIVGADLLSGAAAERAAAADANNAAATTRTPVTAPLIVCLERI